MFLQTIIITVFIYFQTIEDTNGTNILDQSVIKKGRKNNYNAQPRPHLNGLHNILHENKTFLKSGKISLVFAGIFVHAEESAAVLFCGRPLLEDMNGGVDSQAVCF